jgi:hypothetical protein
LKQEKGEMVMKKVIYSLTLVCAMVWLSGCGEQQSAQSDSGVKKASVHIQTDQNGNTVEQKNIADRLTMDNKPGSIKHLYIISPYSGQVLIYSTVRGKVTSSGKRLTPTSVISGYNSGYYGMCVNIGGSGYYTSEVLQDDGSYGNSGEYIYWWDVRGVYHQHYITAGQIIHISDQPVAVKGIIINMETASAPAQE